MAGANADLMLSLHCNSVADPRANGYEGYTLPGQDQSDVLAIRFLKVMVRAFPQIRLRSDLRDGDLDKEMDLRVTLRAAPCRKCYSKAGLFIPPGRRGFSGQLGYPAIAAALGEGSWIGPDGSKGRGDEPE